MTAETASAIAHVLKRELEDVEAYPWTGDDGQMRVRANLASYDDGTAYRYLLVRDDARAWRVEFYDDDLHGDVDEGVAVELPEMRTGLLEADPLDVAFLVVGLLRRAGVRP